MPGQASWGLEEVTPADLLPTVVVSGQHIELCQSLSLLIYLLIDPVLLEGAPPHSAQGSHGTEAGD